MSMCLFVLLVLHPAHASAHDPSCPPPELLGSVDIPAPPYHPHSVFDQEMGYILVEGPKIVLVDLADPTNPVITGSVDIPALTTWITATVDHNTLYIFDHDSFQIIDVADPANPQYIDTHPSTGVIEVVTIHNGYMYIGSNQRTLDIIDLADPHAPVSVSLDHLRDGLLAVINGVGYTTKAQAVDLSDPIHPVLLGTAPLFNGYTRFFHDQDILYAIGWGNSAVIDIAEPLHPRFVHFENNLHASGPQSFAPHGSIFYTLDGQHSGIFVSDASNPRDIYNSTLSFTLPDDAEVYQIYAIGAITYVVTPSSLRAYRFHTNPLVGSHHTIAPGNDITIKDNIAIVANGDTIAGSLQFFDIADPINPILISTLPLADRAVAIDHAGSIAYVANDHEKLNLVDFTDPSNPSIILNIDTGGRTQDVSIVNNLAYVVDKIRGLFIFDITNPADPQLLSTIDPPHLHRDITIDDAHKIAYLSHGRFDLLIIDVADPSSPTIIGSITPIDTGTDGIDATTVANGLLYTAESRDGYRVFDVSSPASPVELARFLPEANGVSIFGFTHQIIIDQDLLTVVNGTGGMIGYDNTDPLNPVQIGWIQARESGPVISSPRRVQLRDHKMYTACFEGGFRTYEFFSCLPCPADLNGDGLLNFFDVSAFLVAFSEGDLGVDLNNDGVLNFFDVSAFLIAFNAGCP